MFRINTPFAVDGKFSFGNPLAVPTSVLPTQFSDAWLNAQQEEIAGFCEAEGLTLDLHDDTQLAQAVALMINRLSVYQATIPEAPYDVDVGDGVLVQRYFGVALEAATTGNPVLVARRGRFRLPKSVAEAMLFGQTLYWSDALKIVTVTPGAIPIVAACVEERLAADPDVLVELNGINA